MAVREWSEIVAGPHNAAALAAVRRLGGAVVRRRASQLVLLHGPPGTGKTALATALVRRIARHPAGLSARTVAARELVSGDDDNPEHDVRDLLTCDLLILEDLQHLPARQAGRLAALLDQRSARRCATLLTASEGPALMLAWPARLRSRLAAGLVIRLAPPDLLTRQAIVERYARKRGVLLEPATAAALANSLGGIRELLGRVERLRGLPNQGRAIAPAELLAAAGSDPSEEGELGLRLAAHRFGVPEKALLGPSRQAKIARARQAAMYVFRTGAGWSLPRIAALFGRDHTTVLHAVRKIAEELPHDPRLARTVEELIQELPNRRAA